MTPARYTNTDVREVIGRRVPRDLQQFLRDIKPDSAHSLVNMVDTTIANPVASLSRYRHHLRARVLPKEMRIRARKLALGRAGVLQRSGPEGYMDMPCSGKLRLRMGALGRIAGPSITRLRRDGKCRASRIVRSIDPVAVCVVAINYWREHWISLDHHQF